MVFRFLFLLVVGRDEDGELETMGMREVGVVGL